MCFNLLLKPTHTIAIGNLLLAIQWLIKPIPAPHGPHFLQFRAVFWKFCQNHMLVPPGGLAPFLRRILDLPQSYIALPF